MFKLVKFMKDKFHTRKKESLKMPQIENNKRFWEECAGMQPGKDKDPGRNQFMNEFKQKWHEHMSPKLGDYFAMTTIKELKKSGEVSFMTLIDPLFLQIMSLEAQASTYHILSDFWSQMAKQAELGKKQHGMGKTTIQ